jgi:hypothetical protein
MKRRTFFQAIAIAPAASALPAQQQGPRSAAGGAEEPKLETVTAAEAGEPVLRFFTSAELASLRRLSALLMPPMNGSPGALECQTPEFLDFLLSQSDSGRQRVYREGINALIDASRRTYRKSFEELEIAQAEALLAPLRQPWTYETPAEPLARFLVTAKSDVHTATVNSREYAAGGAATGGRRIGGQGLYWLPLE